VKPLQAVLKFGLPNFSSDRVCTPYVRQPTYAAKRNVHSAKPTGSCSLLWDSRDLIEGRQP